jgi:hypothetical protein
MNGKKAKVRELIQLYTEYLEKISSLKNRKNRILIELKNHMTKKELEALSDKIQKS